MRSPSYRIVDYDHGWAALFEEEKALVVAATGISPNRVEQVGSTVPGLADEADHRPDGRRPKG